MISPFPPEFKGHGETVLFIEDDDLLRAMYVKSLTRFDYLVLEATNVEEALQVWRAHRGVIRAVIADRHLGIGRDGLSLLQEFGADHPGVALVLASGSLSQGVVETLQANTRIHCLVKPFGLLDLLLILHQSLKDTAP